MKFVTYAEQNDSIPRFGFKVEKQIVDVTGAAEWVNQNNGNDTFLSIPGSLKEALADWDQNFSLLKDLAIEVSNGDLEALSQPESNLIILPPIPDPPAFRDFYAFEQHVRAARQLRGMDMNPDWYKLAIFYFSNPNGPTLYACVLFACACVHTCVPTIAYPTSPRGSGGL